jgi:hypothetical protein
MAFPALTVKRELQEYCGRSFLGFYFDLKIVVSLLNTTATLLL